MPQIAEKLKRNTEEQNALIRIVLVSGIPGSGKGRFAHELVRQLGNEYLKAFDFKMPSVQSSTSYSTPEFVKELNS